MHLRPTCRLTRAIVTQSLDGIAASGAAAFAQRQRLLALCGWETRVMPFAVGEGHSTAPSEAAAVTPEPSGQGREESGAQTPVNQEAQVTRGGRSLLVLRATTGQLHASGRQNATPWDKACEMRCVLSSR